MGHKTKQGALKAARTAMGDEAIEGVDFQLIQTGAGWTHEAMAPVTDAAVEAQAGRAEKVKPAKAPKAPRAPKVPAKAKKAPTAKPSAPEGVTKTDMVVGMLSTAGGATSKEIEGATGWAPHSVRGLLGTLRKRGVNVISKKLPGEPTIYRIAKAKAGAAADPGDVV